MAHKDGVLYGNEMLTPVVDALKNQRKAALGKSPYVFLDKYGRPLNPTPWPNTPRKMR